MPMRQSYQVVDRLSSDSGRTRTYDRLLRRQLLYPTELLSLEYPVIIRCVGCGVKFLRYLSNTYNSPWNRTSQILLIIQSIVKHKKRGSWDPPKTLCKTTLSRVDLFPHLLDQSTLQTPCRWQRHRPVVQCRGGYWPLRHACLQCVPGTIHGCGRQSLQSSFP